MPRLIPRVLRIVMYDLLDNARQAGQKIESASTTAGEGDSLPSSSTGISCRSLCVRCRKWAISLLLRIILLFLQYRAMNDLMR